MGTSSCALFKDGKLIAAVEEERLSRIKNDGSFPLLAIRECLKIANIKIDSIDYIFVYWKPFKIFKRLQIVIKKIFNINKTKFILYHLLSKFFGYHDFKLKKNFPTKQGSWSELFIIRRKIKKIGGNFRGKIIFLNHHDCHIEYALNLSNFDESIDVRVIFESTSDGYYYFPFLKALTNFDLSYSFDPSIENLGTIALPTGAFFLHFIFYLFIGSWSFVALEFLFILLFLIIF